VLAPAPPACCARSKPPPPELTFGSGAGVRSVSSVWLTATPTSTAGRRLLDFSFLSLHTCAPLFEEGVAHFRHARILLWNFDWLELVRQRPLAFHSLESERGDAAVLTKYTRLPRRLRYVLVPCSVPNAAEIATRECQATLIVQQPFSSIFNHLRSPTGMYDGALKARGDAKNVAMPPCTAIADECQRGCVPWHATLNDPGSIN
jgi:hypothetical protein